MDQIQVPHITPVDIKSVLILQDIGTSVSYARYGKYGKGADSPYIYFDF